MDRSNLHAFLVLTVPVTLVLCLSAAEKGTLRPGIQKPFDRFASRVKTRVDGEYLYVESDGLPDHQMMVGITAWQQQVPLPQPYNGDNAWRVPLAPLPAEKPMSAKTAFFRGAIAVAINGVPIFNPIKNDGKTDTFLAGELDTFGGHCGRSDDYHYHVAPVFLSGGDAAQPIAFALDGYAIYGYTEPDGSPVNGLDAFNGHERSGLGYHYHATKAYPYLNGGFHGRVVERDGQVDPQPRARSVREATEPLPGAKITDFTAEKDGKTFELTYALSGRNGSVRYTIVGDGSYRFVLTDPDGTKRERVYRPHGAGGAEGDGPRPPEERPEGPRKGPDPNDPNRHPWLVEHMSEIDTNHDGALTLEEMTNAARQSFTGYDRDGDGRLTGSERSAGGVRTAMGGFVDLHWKELDGDGDGCVTWPELDTASRQMFGKSDRNGDSKISGDELASASASKEPQGPEKRPGGGGKGGTRGGSRTRPERGEEGSLHTEVPPHPFDVILGRPTRDSITISVMTAEAREVCIQYGLRGEKSAKRTAVAKLEALSPVEFTLDGLAPNTSYGYDVLLRRIGESEFAQAESNTFSTQRARGSAFTFTIQADSHLDEPTDPIVYRRTLAGQALDRPDFVIDLGDTFMTDKFRGDFHDAATQYVAQRYYMGILARSAPLFLVLGNHDGETRWREPGSADDMPHWSNAMRTRYFPNPKPDGFYTGNSRSDEFNGPLRDYYAWEWGDALFVVLDPFIATRMNGGDADSGWRWTLGAEQYAWLSKSLSASKSRFKFVFTHHLVGGTDRNARGGSEAARLYEWGGRELDGTSTFAKHRPGFEAPIHELLLETGVNAVFHGHDHFFAKQELDGIVYQCVPQPSHPGNDSERMAADYGYAPGQFLSSPGYMRLTVDPTQVFVSYVQSLTDDPTERKAVTSYGLKPRVSTSESPATGSETPPAPPPSEQPEKPSGPKQRRRADGERAPRGELRKGDEPGPCAERSIVFGRPSTNSITASVLSAADLEARIEYGTQSGTYGSKTSAVTCRAGVPTEIEIEGLNADTRYMYRLCTRPVGSGEFVCGDEADFQTKRPPGSTFSFGVQGDSHPERPGKMYDAELYARTLSCAAAGGLDLYFTLGDDFSIESLIGRKALSQPNVDQVYAHQREFLGLIGATTSLFLVNGNHEEAAGYLLDGTPDCAPVYAGKARTRFYPLPTPNAFYSGDAESVQHVGLLSDYYAFEWGDALFVVIDPYWHSKVQVDADAGGGGRAGPKGKAAGRRDMWGITLGDAQYRWFSKTLKESKARHKFVFAHHVLGTGRGGVEVADLFEWGGKDSRGDERFAEMRPGWDQPIHALMEQTGVTIFFQGHDHLFAHQEKDGVVYQETPNPADPTYAAFNHEAYKSGDILPNSGFLRVTVAPESVRVDYVRCYLAADEKDGVKSGETAFSYTVRARKGSDR